MTPEELLVALFETVTEHVKLPEGYGWAPLASLLFVTGFGLLLLLRGARWAPGFAALTFLAIGGAGGAFLARAVGWPLWPTSAIVGTLGFVLGLIMFRFWQAVLLALCFVMAGFSVYFVRTLHVEVASWLEPGMVALPPADTVVGENRPSAMMELRSLWAHLDQNVPSFKLTATLLALSTALAGLICGLLLPWASRALWAASLGTVFLGLGATALLHQFAPAALDWLLSDNLRAWGIVGAVWLASFILNLATGRRTRARKAPEEAETEAKRKPATA